MDAARSLAAVTLLDKRPIGQGREGSRRYPATHGAPLAPNPPKSGTLNDGRNRGVKQSLSALSTGCASTLVAVPVPRDATLTELRPGALWLGAFLLGGPIVASRGKMHCTTTFVCILYHGGLGCRHGVPVFGKVAEVSFRCSNCCRPAAG